MEHPTYNEWSFNEKINHPGVKRACCRFVGAVVAILVVGILYCLTSAWLFNSMPVFHAEHDAMQAERWRNKAAFYGRACNNDTTKFVVINCNQTFQATTRDYLNDTIARTFAQLTPRHSRSDVVLNGLLGCDDPTGVCMSATHYVATFMIDHPMVGMALGWVTTSVMLMGYAVRAAQQLWRQMWILVPKSQAEEFAALSSAMQEEYTAAMAKYATEGKSFSMLTFNEPEMPVWNGDSPLIDDDADADSDAEQTDTDEPAIYVSKEDSTFQRAAHLRRTTMLE
jgi:hypothetical protein